MKKALLSLGCAVLVAAIYVGLGNLSPVDAQAPGHNIVYTTMTAQQALIVTGYSTGYPVVSTVDNGQAVYGTLKAQLTFTSATSDAATMAGVSATSLCTFSAANATAATNIATTYIGTIAAGSVPITHVTGASGGIVDILCTTN